jgi:hypothetical protein
MCARLGMVTGKGLAGAIRSRHSRWMFWGACALLVVANVINIGADLAGMAEATELVTGLNHGALIPWHTGVGDERTERPGPLAADASGSGARSDPRRRYRTITRTSRIDPRTASRIVPLPLEYMPNCVCLS